MPTKVIMPQLGETIAEGSISKWLKKEGDKIDKDESLVEVTTDKVDMEIPSPAAGIVAKVLAAEGETVEVGQEIAVIEEGAEAATTVTEHETQLAETAEQALSLTPEAKREAETEAPPSGSSVAPTAPEQTPLSKTDIQTEFVSEAAAVPSKLSPPTRSIGIQEAAPEGSRMRQKSGLEGVATRKDRRKKSSPLVRRIAKEHNIDIDQIEGTGVDDRVTKADILAYIEEQGPPKTAAKPKDAVNEAAPPKAERGRIHPNLGLKVSTDLADEIIPLTGMRKAIAEHLVMSKQTIPHTTTIAEVDMTNVVELRQRNKQQFHKAHKVNLTFMPFIIQATAQALKEYPMVNSSLVEEKIIVKKRVNIGVAVAVEKGLILPVIKYADQKSFLEIAAELDDLAKRARTGRLLPDEVQDGTFSITNPGVFGALLSVPIINHPQAAILGVEKIMKAPVVMNDAIAIRSMMYLCTSYDHRIIDGATAIQFLQSIKGQLEECKFELE